MADKTISIKLYENQDAEIIKFLEEKNANTFIIKEALRMYINAYQNMGKQSANSGDKEGEESKKQVISKFMNNKG